jgi:hypothetical protein
MTVVIVMIIVGGRACGAFYEGANKGADNRHAEKTNVAKK